MDYEKVNKELFIFIKGRQHSDLIGGKSNPHVKGSSNWCGKSG
jgi:hypothetical protein